MNSGRFKRLQLFDILNYAFLFVFGLIVMYPLVYVLALSLSSPDSIYWLEVWIVPVEPSLLAYETILFKTGTIYRAYANTIYYSVFGTVIALTVGALTAYPLSISSLYGRKLVTIYFTIPMFFGGGLIPTYLLIRGIGLGNTVWALVLPTAVSFWYIIIIRTNFQGIPVSLSESALIDGASHWTVLFRIILPLSKAIMATVGLFAIVSRWNDFFAPMLYLDEPKKWPLQVILRGIITETERPLKDFAEAEKDAFLESEIGAWKGYREMIKSAAIIVSTGPILLIYPFIQKYFVKGVLVGSIKG